MNIDANVYKSLSIYYNYENVLLIFLKCSLLVPFMQFSFARNICLLHCIAMTAIVSRAFAFCRVVFRQRCFDV